GAGVDHIFADPDLPDVPVVRIVDPDLTMRMTEYVVLHVLAYHRRQRLYDVQQRERVWHEHAQPPASAVAVGVMGRGALAGATLDVFAREPLPVTSPLWRHPKVTITPHNAAFSDPQALAAGVLRQIERFEAGLPLEHVIDRTRGY